MDATRRRRTRDSARQTWYAPEARRRICDGLEFLGITLDQRRNSAGAPLISTEDGRVAVRVIRTDEESMIARAAAEFIPRARADSGRDS